MNRIIASMIAAAAITTSTAALADDFSDCRAEAMSERQTSLRDNCTGLRGEALSSCTTRITEVYYRATERCNDNEQARLQLLADREREARAQQQLRAADTARRAPQPLPRQRPRAAPRPQ